MWMCIRAIVIAGKRKKATLLITIMAIHIQKKMDGK